MVRSRVHRLPENRYVGRVAVAFTACLAERTPYFTAQERVAPHHALLAEEITKAGCIAYAYVFMPDHLHAVVLGIKDDSLPKVAFTRFKQRSGYLLGKASVRWQPSFYDHVLRYNEDVPGQVLYVFNNPLRAGLTDDPFTYPYSGSIGMEYDEVLQTVLNL